MNPCEPPAPCQVADIPFIGVCLALMADVPVGFMCVTVLHKPKAPFKAVPPKEQTQEK